MYLFVQSSSNSTLSVIIDNPRIENGTVYATQIGIFSGWNNKREEVYQACSPVDFIAGGGPWSMTEFTDKLITPNELQFN